MKVKIRPHLILLYKNLDPKANLLQKTVLPAMLKELVYGLNVENDLPHSVAEPPLFRAAPAPDGQDPGADSGSELLGSAPAPGKKRQFQAAPASIQCCRAGPFLTGSGSSSVAEPEPVLFGRSRSRCKDVKAKTCFLLLFSLFLYEKEPEPVNKKYLEPELVKKGPAPQHCTSVPVLQYRILRLKIINKSLIYLLCETSETTEVY